MRLSTTIGVTALALALLLDGCGGVTSSQVVARDKATKAGCDWYAMCDQIGAAPRTYTTRASCDAQVNAYWDQAWPTAECEGKINQMELQTCLNAIAATQCANGIDFLVTLGIKCPKANVCKGP
jgi:hypothetical protein